MKNTQQEEPLNKMPDTPQSSPSGKKPRVSTTDKIKFFGLLAFIALLIFAGIQLLPYFEQLTTEQGRLELVELIKGAGVGGIGICLALQFIQIIVAFIPGEITQVAIGAIYGPLLGTIIILTGALISTIFIFYVVRKLGAPFVQGMIGSKDSKILKFLDKGNRLNVIVFILFLIPGLPKDVFTYLVPLTKIRPINYFALSTLGRTPGVAASAFIGNAALQGDYTQAIIVGIIAGGLGLLGIIFNKQILAVVDKVEDSIKEKRDEKREDLKTSLGSTKEMIKAKGQKESSEQEASKTGKIE